MEGSFISGSSGPKPKTSSRISSMMRSRSGSVIGMFSWSRSFSTAWPISPRSRSLLMSRSVSLLSDCSSLRWTFDLRSKWRSG